MVAKELLEQYTGMESLCRMLGTFGCPDKGILRNLEYYA
jgi:hypothetical protein